MPLATGVEARLIQAEVLLLQNNLVGYRDYLNLVRAYYNLSPFTIPASQAEGVDILFSERGFTLMATGQRLWDLRRLVSVYTRDPSSVFPTGAFPQGGNYGTDGNFPVPTSARGPSFSGCTVRGY